MATMSINGVLQGSYRYDFAGRQAIRTIAATGITIHSVFDSQGRRIAEYNEATGAIIREYVWLGWEPIAVIEGGVTNLIRTDHIGRPVFATNTAGVKTWTATYDPFGTVRTTVGTPIPARFPGQWFQAESGLHQNWMRDYDPTTGRYLQADPLGLVDGASVYGYAGQNPMMYTDPRGLAIVVFPQSRPTTSENDPVLCQGVIDVCRLLPEGQGGRTYHPTPGSRDGIPLHPYTTCTYECGSGPNRRILIRNPSGNVRCPAIIQPRPDDITYPAPSPMISIPPEPLFPRISPPEPAQTSSFLWALTVLSIIIGGLVLN